MKTPAEPGLGYLEFQTGRIWNCSSGLIIVQLGYMRDRLFLDILKIADISKSATLEPTLEQSRTIGINNICPSEEFLA
jgi:hypothetical protein